MTEDDVLHDLGCSALLKMFYMNKDDALHD